ncbi:MAG: element excision factor XisH family protein [Cyanophyceae cyanobacterium]
MPRRDLYHDTVKSALIKDGWTITHDPYVLGDAELYVFSDLCASKTNQTVTVEIKVFGVNGRTSELEKAVGQYVLYRSVLKNENLPTLTYLAIPSQAYHSFFQKRIVRDLIRDEDIKLLVFDPSTETIEQWNP